METNCPENVNRKVWILASNLLNQYTPHYFQFLKSMPQKDRDELMHTASRNIASAIHDLPVIYSGKISDKLIDPETGYRVFPWKPSKEHFYSRQRAGGKVLRVLRRGTDLKEIIALLDKYRQVHLITSKENFALQQIQMKYPTWTHLEHQAEAGIVLVDDPGAVPTVQDYPVIVNGVRYNTVLECSKLLNVPKQTVIKRCRNEKPKWVDWQFIGDNR